jgi:hypothetical protein
MKKRLFFSNGVVLLAVIGIFLALTSGVALSQYQLRNGGFSAWGGTFSSSGYQLQASAGQPHPTGPLSNTNYIMSPGFFTTFIPFTSNIAISIPDTLEGMADDTVDVPVYLSLNGNGVGTLGTDIIDVNSLLSYLDFSAGPIIPGGSLNVSGLPPDSVRLSFSSAGSGPITQDGLLVTLHYLVDPNAVAGEMALLEFSRLSAADSLGNLLAINTNSGRITIIEAFFSISGEILYCDPNTGGNPLKPVAGMDVELSQGANLLQTVQTGGSGNYQVENILLGSGYRVEAHRPGSGVGSEINPTDAFLAFNHFLGSVALSGCQKLAADVDSNLVIQPTDALAIFNRFLGIISQYPAGDDWRAYPASFDIDATPDAWKTTPEGIDFPNINGNQPDQDFYAVVRGDVNLDWIPTAASSKTRMVREESHESEPANSISFQVSNISVSPAEKAITFQVQIAGEGLKHGVYAFGGELRYDAAALQVTEIRRGKAIPIQDYQLGYNSLTNSSKISTIAVEEIEPFSGRLRFGGFSVAPEAFLKDGGTLLEVEARLITKLTPGASLPIQLVEASAVTGHPQSSSSKVRFSKG